MKRWHSKLKTDVENLKIDAFLRDVMAVCKAHNLSISHEDSQGGFLIEKYTNQNADWLVNASDNTDELPSAPNELTTYFDHAR